MYTQIGCKMEDSESLTLLAEQHAEAAQNAISQQLDSNPLVQRPSFRSRNRPTVTWGPPPPVASYNVTQLPFKIDETPSSSPSKNAITSSANLSSSPSSSSALVDNKENKNNIIFSLSDESSSTGSSDKDSD